jgi:hypothetical protein
LIKPEQNLSFALKNLFVLLLLYDIILKLENLRMKWYLDKAYSKVCLRSQYNLTAHMITNKIILFFGKAQANYIILKNIQNLK